MRLFAALFLLSISFYITSALASPDLQEQHATAKALVDADIIDMISAGLSPEIVIAKIASSTCEFDTSPADLKKLKASNVPEAVILAMIQATNRSHGPEPTEPQRSAPALVRCTHTDPVPVFSAPRVQQNGNQSGSDFYKVFNLKCGDRVTLINPEDDQTWIKIRAADGQEGYMASILLSRDRSLESNPKEHASTASSKQEDIQKASDDLEDCRTRSQNEYDTKMNAINTVALQPMTRVAASSRLKQNYDVELRQCRSQYEARLKEINAE
jgi:hypothetical protein